MNKHNSPVTPDENRIEELLAKIQPTPGEQFHQKMRQMAWRAEAKQVPMGRHFRWKLAAAIATLVILAGLFTTPQGRAWAQQVFQFFIRINSTTVQLPESEVKWLQEYDNDYDLPLAPVFIPTVSPEMAKLPGCETPQSSQSYHCQIAFAESQLGLDLMELPATPEGWKFESISFDPYSKTANIRYSFDISSSTSYSMLNISQGTGALPAWNQTSPWAAVPADSVEVVKIGNYDGEYVKGSFSLPAGSENLVWDDSDRHTRLAWSDGTHWVLLELRPNLNLPNTMGRDQLIELAESLASAPSEQEEALDPDALYSISDAEALSGLDLKAPTILPIETDFSYARYDASNQQVRLFYGPNDELVIYEWNGKSFELDELAKIENSNNRIVLVNGNKAYYAAVDGPDERLFLWWKDDELFYQMYYYQYLGAQLNQEKMIAIAESMQDIDDFRSKDHVPYERVSIYEQALNIDAKEFATSPAGWTFERVWANPASPCIGLVYSSTDQPVWLSINQCKTDEYFDTSDVPFFKIRPVKIGHNWGKYIAGSFITNPNGQMTWDSDAPVKQLYWQQDGLWIQLSIGGEGAAGYDKKDLISYAESLR